MFGSRKTINRCLRASNSIDDNWKNPTTVKDKVQPTLKNFQKFTYIPHRLHQGQGQLFGNDSAVEDASKWPQLLWSHGSKGAHLTLATSSHWAHKAQQEMKWLLLMFQPELTHMLCCMNKAVLIGLSGRTLWDHWFFYLCDENGNCESFM